MLDAGPSDGAEGDVTVSEPSELAVWVGSVPEGPHAVNEPRAPATISVRQARIAHHRALSRSTALLCQRMLVAGPQRRLFFACVIAGFGSLLLLDLHFAPTSLAADERTGADASPASSQATEPAAVPDGSSRMTARVVIPAPARVPTIVAKFETASTEPLDQSAIRALATAMIEDHDVSVVLEGHSDTRGGDDYNHKISLERADWVKTRLVELGVSAERVETVGLGATRPLRSDDPDAPSVNRRVEVRWLGNAAHEAPPPTRPSAKPAVASAASSGPREPRPPRPERADASVPGATPATASASPVPVVPAFDASARSNEPSSSPEEEPPHAPPGAKSPQPGDD